MDLLMRRHIDNIPINKIIVGLAFVVAVYVSFVILLYRGISFDGAFNAQAALNLFQGNGLTFDYEKQLYIQTGLPFQILNGFFLTVFGRHYFAANLANLCFYWLFFLLVLDLNRKTSSVLPLFAFIIISFMPSFMAISFGGYGEFPSLVLAISGAYILVLNYKKSLYLCTGAVLLGLAFATKWIMIFFVPPLLIICILIIISDDYKPVIKGFFIFGMTLVVSSLIQYYPYEKDRISYLFHALWNQGTGTNSNLYPDLFTRLSSFMHVYEANSGIDFLAWLKLILVILIALNGIILIYFELFNKNNIYYDEKNRFLIFLSLFVFIYLFTWFFIQQKNWYRRIFNSDIIIFLSLSLMPYAYNKTKYKKLINYSCIVIFLIFFIAYIPSGIQKYNDCTPTESVENELLTSLSLLPENYIGYGYGWWQAPRWSFLSGKKFDNLFTSPAVYRSLVYNNSSFIFYGPENVLDKNNLKYVEKTYELNEIYTYKGFRISQLKGFNQSEVIFVQDIDFSQGDFSQSIKGFWRRENNEFRHSKIESVVFLNNTNNLSKIIIDSYATPRLEDVDLKVLVSFEDSSKNEIYDVPIKSGNNAIYLDVPQNSGDQIRLYIFHTQGLVPPDGDSRLIGITVKRIALVDDIQVNNYSQISNESK